MVKKVMTQDQPENHFSPKWYLAILLGLGIFLFSSLSQAIDIRLGGQMRPRYEIQDRDFDKETESFQFLSTRIRLNVKTKVDEQLSSFIQFQSVRNFGDFDSGSSIDERDNSVGIHQAYFTVKKPFDLPMEVKFGRQEIILDGHRLFGNNGWNQGATTHDGVSIWLKKKNLTLTYIFSQTQENGTEGNDDDRDSTVHVAWLNLKKVLGGKFSGYFIYADEDSLNGQEFPDNDIYTFGFRQAGKVFGLKYRGEFYYQIGSADFLENTTNSGRSAFLFGVRIGKNFDVKYKPFITLWYDYLSGDSNEDEIYTAFDPLFPTGHKYHGFMDRFLNVGRAKPDGSFNLANGTQALGLQDLAVKVGFQPFKKVTIKGDLHFFWTAQEAHSAVVPASVVGDTYLGEELDLTLIYRFHPNLTFIGGYSLFLAEELMHNVGGRPDSTSFKPGDSDWGFIMLNYVF